MGFSARDAYRRNATPAAVRPWLSRLNRKPVVTPSRDRIPGRARAARPAMMTVPPVPTAVPQQFVSHPMAGIDQYDASAALADLERYASSRGVPPASDPEVTSRETAVFPGIRALMPTVATPQSSWVLNFTFVQNGGESGLAVQFKSGAMCFYPGTSPRQYLQFDAAASKGEWVWENLYDREYDLL